MTDVMAPTNLSASGSKVDLQNHTTPDHGLHNPILFVNKNNLSLHID